jgi:hypothetical protein
MKTSAMAIAMAAVGDPHDRTVHPFIRSFPHREHLGYHDTEPCVILASNRCIRLHADFTAR